MSFLRRGLCRVVVGVLAIVLFPACNEGVSCTLIGGSSGVAFDVNAWAATQPSAKTAKACVQQTCQTFTITRPMLLFVEDVSLRGEGTVDVTLVIRDVTGHALFDGAAAVPLMKRQPNGPKCEPTLWQASVVPVGRAQLVARPLAIR